MTLPSSGTISVATINGEIGRPATYSSDLNFLNSLIKYNRPGQPNLAAFYGLTYFQSNAQGNCNNGNCNCSGNCGNIQCQQCFASQCINCANCDGSPLLQPNCNCACTYNCNANISSYNCNCNCSKIICAKLHELGLMPRNIFQADQNFGELLRKTDPNMYEGYVRWAQTVVDWMEGDGPEVMIWIRDKEQRKLREKQASINWSYKIATPWSEHMAYLMGAIKTDNEIGRILMGIGRPICRLVSKLPPKQQMGVAGTWTLCSLFFGSYYIASSYVGIKNLFKKVKSKLIVRSV